MRILAAAFALTASSAMASDWQIAEIDGSPTTGAPSLQFTDDGRISGSTGCNRFTGSARAEDGTLVIDGGIATTRMACINSDVVVQETLIVELLSGTVALQHDPFTQGLTLAGNGVTATLVPAEPDVADAAFVIVSGVDATLNIRREATTQSGVVSHASLGQVMRNLGCEDRTDRTWCQIKYTDDSGTEGWAAAEYLAPATAARRAGAELFDQIGRLDCRPAGASEPEKCDYGVAREGDGTGAILVYFPDNDRLLLDYRENTFTASAGVSERVTEAQDMGETVRVTAAAHVVDVPLSAFVAE
ncbi:META domain-containing protein [Chachezhania antarctica]|uniref:META domain-containing protein n=1 Tax=Chachezhania antarctica TaxID=2340860 RepID=UPI001968ABBE|nr:META domain-containing protein [Chachezhania antarctica]